MATSDAGEVSIELSRGIARLGRISLDIERLDDGTLRLGGSTGPRVRRLLFAERSEIVAAARRSGRPAETLPALLVERCTLERGREPVEPRLLAGVCLHLCGADLPAPAFERTQQLVAHLTGWTAAQIGRQPAVEIDGMAVQFTAMLGHGEEPAPRTESGQDRSVGSLIENLMRRGPGDAAGPLAADELALLERLGKQASPGRHVIANGRGDASARSSSAWALPESSQS
ncbi:MAG TPA: hypothetical protein VK824_08275 [Planctomycetota bacterium]|nr:hypothetical protein [Planctomycetota bacterium]